MKRSTLHRAAGAGVVLALAVALLSARVVGTTFAFFNGQTTNTGSAFAGGWVDPPASFIPTPSGYDMSFAWTPGTHGPVTGQQLYGVDNTTNSNCTGAAYAAIGSALTAAASSTTQASVANAANNGDWYCYQLLSTSATNWTAPATAAVQIGLVASAISTANGATKCTGAAANPATGVVDCNDTITINFNQKPILPTGNQRVCFFSAGLIIIGDGSNCTNTNNTPTIGKITGYTIGTSRSYTSSAYTLTQSAAGQPWVFKITLAGATTTSTISGTGTFVPASGILSTVTTHQATLCTAATANCQPTTSTTF